jgi:hypothetical protein
MTTVAAKLWFAVSGLAFAGFVAYELASSGEWFGSFLLITIVVVAGMLGVLATVLRDGDVPATTSSDVPVRRSLAAAWPALGAVGAGVAIVGLAGGNALLYVGLGILGFVFVEWMVQAWAERATGDPSYNHALRHRIMSPVEIPLLALLVIAVFLISTSRVLLALPKNGSTVFAISLAVLILVGASLFAARPRLGSSVLAGALALGAVALIAGGIAGGVAGERKVEEHHVKGANGQTTTTVTTVAGSGGTSVTQPGADSNSTPASTP